MKKLTLVWAALLPMLVSAQAFASSAKEIKARFNQLQIGDRTLCLSDITYANNKTMKVIENGFVIKKTPNALVYQTAVIYLLGNDVTVNIKAMVNSKLDKTEVKSQVQDAMIKVTGLDLPEQAADKAKVMKSYQDLVAKPENSVAYSDITLNEKGYVTQQHEGEAREVSTCYITPLKTAG
ncbi:hypothetical protein [Rouxiella aceris]|nr:hypothetical protein [Rouxiella aceris]